MRITIIGVTGSGKSTLAREISKKFDIPCMHIDDFWIKSRGHKLKPNDKEGKEKVRKYILEKVLDFIEQDSWVSDGFYSKIQPFIADKADQIIFLKIPLYRRFFNQVKRIFKPRRFTEISRWEDIKFLYQTIKRTFTTGSKIKKFIKENPDKVKVLKNYREINKYLRDLNE